MKARVLSLCLLLVACSTETSPDEHEADSEMDARVGDCTAGDVRCQLDAGDIVQDAGRPVDGGSDAGSDEDTMDAAIDAAVDDTRDGGSEPDGSTPLDGGPDGGTDAGTPDPNRFEVDRTPTSGLDAPTLQALEQGGSTCTVNVVYPYADTVFPSGIVPPAIMWQGGGQAASVSVSYESSSIVKYAFAATATKELTIPTNDWKEIVARAPGSPLVVKLNVKNGSAVSTCTLRWRIAPGQLVGNLYYSTYHHPSDAGTASIVRMPLGGQASRYLSVLGAAPSGPCKSCHSASANGAVVVATEHMYGPVTQSYQSQSYRVGSAANPAALSSLGDVPFGALTPDGALVLRMGNPDCTEGAQIFPRAPRNFMLAAGPSTAQLLNTSTGNPVSASGLTAGNFMWMAQFSPRGDKVVFNYAKLASGTVTDRRELAVMDFNATTRTFSNLRVIASNQGGALTFSDYLPNQSSVGSILGTVNGSSCAPSLSGDAAYGKIVNGSCSGPCYPAWPSFTPDGNGVIYSLISEPDFAITFFGRTTPSKSELWYADLTTGERVKMSRANAALEDESIQINYYPSVLPVQVGGYYWLFFTSTRKWGTRSTDGSPQEVANYESVYGASTAKSFRKRVWVSALRPRLEPNGAFSSSPLSDPSSPPFYLPGQGDTGNFRPVATRPLCEPLGEECASGVDCCSGFCELADGEAVGTCVEEVSCSQLNDRCETHADCCPGADGKPAQLCMGGTCGKLLP